MPEVKRVTLRDGHTAFICYVDGDFKPVEYKDAKMMHIAIDDGESIWAVPQPIDTLDLKR